MRLVGPLLLAGLGLLAPLSSVAAPLQFHGLLEESEALLPWLVSTRRHLHTIPELGFDLPKTSAYVRSKLDELGIKYKEGVATSGVVATLGSGSPTVGLRADMDALPILENSGVEYQSTHEGKMHACGHDTHTTMLLGAARLLKEREASLGGTVRLLFQPAEEGGAGGERFVKEGALEGVSALHGLHVWPGAPTGRVGSKAGTLMAAADRFWVTISGKGGHAATPHLTKDPVLAASSIVVTLQPLVSRETSPTKGAVVTVSRFNTGEGAANVIPDAVELSGTVRALTKEHFEVLRRRVQEVVEGTAALHGCNTTFKWSDKAYPPTVCDAEMVALAKRVAGKVTGPERWTDMAEPTMAAEDFSFMAEAVPAVFAFLGVRNESVGSVHGLHTPQFRMDESAMPLGAALHAGFALEYLSASRAEVPEGVPEGVPEEVADAAATGAKEEL